MRSSFPLALLAWSVSAVADSASTKATDPTTSSCAAQAVLDACLGMLQPRLAACPPNDWNCMCSESINVLTCYNNCPKDTGAFGAEQTKISYCNAANAYPSSTSAIAVASSSNGAIQPSSTSEGSSGTASSSSPTGSSSSSAATPSSSSVKVSTGAAAGLVVEVGSLLAAIVLGVGAVL